MRPMVSCFSWLCFGFIFRPFEAGTQWPAKLFVFDFRDHLIDGSGSLLRVLAITLA